LFLVLLLIQTCGDSVSYSLPQSAVHWLTICGSLPDVDRGIYYRLLGGCIYNLTVEIRHLGILWQFLDDAFVLLSDLVVGLEEGTENGTLGGQVGGFRRFLVGNLVDESVAVSAKRERR
jgi:hypothetical protein